MIAPLEQIKELIAGEAEELQIDQEPPKVGAVVPVQAGRGKRTKCHVKIVDTWPHKDGGHVVLCELAPFPHEPRLLRPARAGDDYTTSPGMALTSGHEPEPEAVTKEEQDAITEEAHMLGHQEAVARRLRWEQEDFISRLEDQIVEAERLGIEPGREMARLEAGLSALARRNAMAKQQRRKAA